jgi:hypothetical protein
VKRRCPYGSLAQSEVYSCVPALSEAGTAEIAERVFVRHSRELRVDEPQELQARVRQHLYNLRALGRVALRREHGKLFWKRFAAGAPGVPE